MPARGDDVVVIVRVRALMDGWRLVRLVRSVKLKLGLRTPLLALGAGNLRETILQAILIRLSLISITYQNTIVRTVKMKKLNSKQLVAST